MVLPGERYTSWRTSDINYGNCCYKGMGKVWEHQLELAKYNEHRIYIYVLQLIDTKVIPEVGSCLASHLRDYQRSPKTGK